MTLTLPVDAEKLVSAFLRDQAEITALVGTRVFTVLPTNGLEFPCIRVTRWAGNSDGFAYLDRPALQVDCWADRKAEAAQLAATVKAALALRVRGQHATGAVSAVEFEGEGATMDEAFSPTKARYRLDVALTTHPLP